MNKKLLALLLVVVLCVACVGGSTSAYASTSVNKFDNTDVLDDLKGSTIAGKEFSVDDYPLSTERTLRVISLLEYCYTADINTVDNYALYLYVYNPEGKAIENSASNKVQLCVAFNAEGKAISYDKYELKVCDVSKDNLFIKFKVVDSKSIYPVVYVGERRYDVSSIEIKFKGQDVIDYGVGNSWTYTGFSAGCGVDKSTLQCRTDAVETVELDVKSTWYRYANDTAISQQLSSVWFGVDERLLVDYGELQKIKASWFETKTAPMVVLTNKTVYDDLLPYVSFNTFLDETTPWGLHSNDTLGDSGIYLWTYGFSSRGYYETTENLCWLFYDEDGNVTSETVSKYALEHDHRASSISLFGKYKKCLFDESVDQGRTYGFQTHEIDARASFSLQGFSASSKFMEWYISKFFPGIRLDTLENISPIYEVKSSDFLGSQDDISDKLLIVKDDIPDLYDDYISNMQKGKNTYLFRFAITDYEALEISAWDNSAIAFGRTKDVGYVSGQTVFLDFDVISLTFIKDDVETTVPCVSDPVDIFGGLTPPPSFKVPWWVWAIIIGVAVILAFIYLEKIFQVIIFVFKAIWFVVKNFFLGIYYIFDFLFGWIFRRK